jgi:hypothetical protein
MASYYKRDKVLLLIHMQFIPFLLALAGMIFTQGVVHGQVQPPNTLDIKVQKIASGGIVVGIHNHTDKSIRVWRDSNS